MVLSLLECILCQSSISLVQGDTKALVCHLASEHKATKEERKMTNEENKATKEENKAKTKEENKAKTKEEENKMSKHLALLLAIHCLTEVCNE